MYKVRATISFRDEQNETQKHFIELGIVEPSTGSSNGTPSLLGRDIINDYKMVFDAHTSCIYFD